MGMGGRSEMGDAPGTAGDLRSDPLFADFLQGEFNASDFASNALAGSSATAQARVEQLEGGIRVLKDRLAGEVASRQEELQDQAASLRDADGAIQGISLAADSLDSAVRRVRDEIMEPYEAIRLKTLQLKNLQGTTDLLRLILQSTKMTQRLRAHIKTGPSGGNTQGILQLSVLDLGKAAKLVTDIRAVSQEADLSRIQVVNEEVDFLEAVRQLVRSQAQEALTRGLDSLSQAEVGSALQIFFNLQDLSQACQEVVEGHLKGLQRALSTALDPKKLVGDAGGSSGILGGGPGGARALAASARVQEGLWQGLGGFTEQLLRSCTAVWHLHRVLAKKRDPLTHALFLDSLSLEGGPPLTLFWDRVCAMVTSALEAATAPSKGGVVRESLVHSYPRLATLLEDFFKKLHYETNVKGVIPGVDPKQEEGLFEAAACCQNLYLGAVLSRVSDAVNSAFTGGNRALPTATELHKCIGRMHEELKAVGDSPRLAGLIAQMVGKSLRMLAEKAEYMSAGGQELRSIGGACTSAQLRNITLCNQLQEVSRSIASFLPRLPPQAAALLRGPLEVVEAGAVEVVLPLMRAVVERGEGLVQKMHDQGYAQEGSGTPSRPSPHIQELCRHLSHSRVEYLSKFNPLANPQNRGSVGAALTERFAARMLLFFVRHASLLRPLSPAGTAQLLKDMGELEGAIAANLWPLEALGTPHRVFQGFRRLLSLEASQLHDSTLLGELPPLVVCHHLFSRGPPALQSPHARAGFTPQQYSLWLDQHTKAEALHRVKAALEASQGAAKDEPGFEAVYPVMLRLCS